MRSCSSTLALIAGAAPQSARCRACRATDRTEAAAALIKLQAGLKGAMALLAEAAADPTWVLVGAGFPMVRVQALLEEGVAELLALLSLTLRVVQLHDALSSLPSASSESASARAGHWQSPSQAQAAGEGPGFKLMMGECGPAAKVLVPLAPSLKAVQSRLSDLLLCLANELEPDNTSTHHADLNAAAATAFSVLSSSSFPRTSCCVHRLLMR